MVVGALRFEMHVEERQEEDLITRLHHVPFLPPQAQGHYNET